MAKPDTVSVVYLGPDANGVYIPASDQFAHTGVPLAVDAELAGRPPSGEPGSEGSDPGEGLLAQEATFAKTGTKAAKEAAERRTKAQQSAPTTESEE